MTPLDIVPWEGMKGYDMGYPTKYITPFRAVLKNKIIIVLILRYFDRDRKIILKTNSSNYINEDVLS